MTQNVLYLDIAGNPQKWISRNDTITYHAKGLVAWSYGSESFTYHGGISRLTGEQVKITSATIIAVRGESKVQRWNRPPTLTNQALFARDLHICAYCGKHFPASKLTRDHIQPLSRGGTDSWSNVVAACERCNHKKANKLLEKSGMSLLYVPYVPNQAEVLILKNRKIIYDQMTFLLNFIPDSSRIKQHLSQ
ncbi:MAG: HNH endonuclease [Candidatus Nitrosotenuis sp.]